MDNFVIQAIGFVGIALNFLVFQQKSRKRLLTVKLSSDFVWALHYFLLYAFSGCAIAVVGIFREVIASNSGKKWADSKLWPTLFIVIGVIAALVTGKNVYRIFPAVASALSVICFWQKKTSNSRILALPISFCMIIYSMFSGSVAGVANELLTILSVIIGFFRMDVKDKHNV